MFLPASLVIETDLVAETNTEISLNHLQCSGMKYLFKKTNVQIIIDSGSLRKY